MHKIYSRPRIRIPKIKIQIPRIHGMPRIPKRNTKIRKILPVIIVLIIAFSTVRIILGSVEPIFDALCENKARSIATKVSNEQATSVMKQHSYDELFTIEKDNEGNISMIKSNVIPINEIISDVANKIQEEIDKGGRKNVEIALGSFTGFKLLSGRGPGVKIRITPVGEVETDLKSEFIAQGINQTLHRVYLQVSCEVNILTPFDNMERNITNQVLLLENIIVGKIPDTYYNLEGMNSPSDTLEAIE